jgi:hypothetical protein
MNAHKKPTVFISYSHADSHFVDNLAGRLKETGVDVWIDKWMIKVGDSITGKINEGIGASDFLIIVLSRSSVKSKWVREELNTALVQNVEVEKGAFILPVLKEDCGIPSLLKHRKYANFKDDPKKGFKELVEVIQPAQILIPELDRIPSGEFLIGRDPEKDKYAMDRKRNDNSRIIAAVIGGIAVVIAAIIGRDVIIKDGGDSDLGKTATAVTQRTAESLYTQLLLEGTRTAVAEQQTAPTEFVEPVTPEPTLPTDAPSPVIVMTATSTLLAPTSTSTIASSPTFSPTPTSQISFPFIDNFDEQKSSLWEELSGTWLIEEGRYTGLAGTGVGWFWTKLNITDLSDFRLSMNVKIPSYGAANEGEFAIIVRESQTKKGYIGYVFGFPRSTGSWSFIEEADRSAITNTFEKVPAEANFVIEVVGDRFVAKVNGFEKQSITISGYDRTWIGLGLKCGYKCPSFDDLRLEPIP